MLTYKSAICCKLSCLSWFVISTSKQKSATNIASSLVFQLTLGLRCTRGGAGRLPRRAVDEHPQGLERVRSLGLGCASDHSGKHEGAQLQWVPGLGRVGAELASDGWPVSRRGAVLRAGAPPTVPQEPHGSYNQAAPNVRLP